MNKDIVTIAVDAMGGDRAPDEVVRGAAEVSLERHPVQMILVGDAPRITQLLAELRHDPERIAVRHSPSAIRMDDRPREALDAHPDASIAVAAGLCASGEADALVSAGNTGAAVLACSRLWRRIPGIRRAALAAVYPTELRRGEKDDPFSLLLDVGAGNHADAEDLVAFALLGSIYASRVSKNPRPRVALLSNGVEDVKGPPEIVEAHHALRSLPAINFVGNIEGVDIPRGTADVVVTSGFVGNVVLKMLEGVSETVMALARYAYKEKLVWRAGLMMLSGGIRRLKSLTDWEQYGGAPLLGFDHLFIKAHGRSGARAIANAIKVAARTAQSGVTAEVEQALAVYREQQAQRQGAPAVAGSDVAERR
jgi:glycerol-3-phosphate acyltransferase PlsX